MRTAKTDLSLRWAHTHFVGFVMSRLILNSKIITRSPKSFCSKPFIPMWPLVGPFYMNGYMKRSMCCDSFNASTMRLVCQCNGKCFIQ